MMTPTDRDIKHLDAVLRDARKQETRVPAHLMAAVLADARRLQPGLTVPPVRASAVVRTRLFDLLGGWRAMGGLAVATCAGLWIGISPPAMLQDAEAVLFGAMPADYTNDAAGFGWTMDEG